MLAVVVVALMVELLGLVALVVEVLVLLQVAEIMVQQILAAGLVLGATILEALAAPVS